LSEALKRYSEALIEIQVASVLMHSWAEVEHDLVYKPMEGKLSDDEYAILDELNGLVIAGEIALERLQRSGETRVAVKGRIFSNHYELAAFLLTQAAAVLKDPDPEALLGRVDVLYRLLGTINKATPDTLEPYLKSLSTDFERRPLADQIIDQLLAEAPERYEIYTKLRAQESFERAPSIERRPDIDQTHASMGRFLTSWIEFERELRRRAQAKFPGAEFIVPTGRLLQNLQILDPHTLAQTERIRRFRNMLVHGIEIPSAADIDDANQSLQSILAMLNVPKKRKSTGRKRKGSQHGARRKSKRKR